jgi:hypothetical protein
VQIQIEGSTLAGIKQFAAYDAREHLIDYCHKLGMTVTIWVHELSDLPAPWLPEWLGPVTPDNTALWNVLNDRYEWMLRDEIPNIDGLCLTVVETQIRATDPDVMAKLATLIRSKCDKYHKQFMLRTFVWYPDEFSDVMKGIAKLPADTVIMSKCVPQDWQLRGMFASEIGDVGGKPQIIEYDVAGEYFRRNEVANCMPELLKKHFDYDLKNHVQGVCLRVDREDESVLDQPSEVNLWTLGMLAAGASNDLDEIWRAWASNRFGAKAADGVVAALKPAGSIVEEMLSVGPFTFGDTRQFPILADEYVLQPWQNYFWDPAKYEPIHEQEESGDPAFVAQVAADKARARQQAELCLTNLDLVKDQLSPQDYQILHTRLLSNKIQLSFRAPMVMATLHYNQMMSAETPEGRDAADRLMQADLAELRAAVLPIYPDPTQITYLGKTWNVGPPDGVPREQIYQWAYQMDLLRRGEDPRPERPGAGEPKK